MSLYAIAARVLFGYLVLLLLTRVSGKRTLRQVTPLDMTAALIAGDLVDDLLWAEVPAAQFVTALGTLIMLAVIVTAGTARSPRLERWVMGSPVEVVRNGEVVDRGRARERLEETELMMLLREQGIDDLREVERATLEVNGVLGVCQRNWAREAQKQDAVHVRRAVETPQ